MTASTARGGSQLGAKSRRYRMYRVVVFVLAVALILGVFAPVATVGSAPPTVEEILLRHKIELTLPSLIAALRNPDANVRGLAATALADKHALAAVPAIHDALAAEAVPRTRVNLAFALGLLGDHEGYKELKSICADKNYDPEFRLYAVRYMFDLHFQDERDCLLAAQQLTASDNFGDRISALSLLPRFHAGENHAEILNIVLVRLKDSEPTVRMAAADALVQIHDLAAIPSLRESITAEDDPNVRANLENSLGRLQASRRQ